MNRMTVGLVFAIVLVGRFVGGGSSGASLNWINGEWRVEGGTSPWALATSALLLVLVWLVHDEEVWLGAPTLAKTSQRALASFVDVITTFLAGLGILGIIPATVEWLWTGKFNFYFVRAEVRWSDFIVMTAEMVLWVGFIVLYFRDSLRKPRQTLGSYISGVVVIQVDSNPISVWRVLGRVLAVYAATFCFPITLIIGRDREGSFWHDQVTGFKVVRRAKPTGSQEISSQG